MPRVVVCTAAERPPVVFPNVYYGSQVIGLCVRLRGRRYLSVVWARPSVPKPLECKECGHPVPYAGSRREQAERAFDHWQVVHGG